MEEKLKQFIEASQKILITSHISPDPDAISSVLLLGSTIKENYPDKEVSMVLEEQPTTDLRFVENYQQLKFAHLNSFIIQSNPELLIIVDANTYNRVSRNEGEQIRSYAKERKGDLKTAVIDHHEIEGKDETDVFINNKRPATAEEVYVLCFEKLKLKRPQGYAQTALLGIISDTQRHRFDHPGYHETFRVVSELLDAGASMEKLENQLEHYSKNELEAVSEFAKNITADEAGYAYSFISDEFLRSWASANKPAADLKNAAEMFVNRFIRSFENNEWGFVIYPDLVAGPNCFGVSLRAHSDSQDVSAIARKLGGGGHKPAAGAKIKATSATEALKIVRQVIE